MTTDLAHLADSIRQEEQIIKEGGGRAAVERQHSRGRMSAREREIVISVGIDTETHRRIIVRNPRRVRIESDGGVDQALQIEEGDGSVTRVAFRSPIAPELVDGLAP